MKTSPQLSNHRPLPAQNWLAPVSALLGVLAWHLLTNLLHLPDFILPTPQMVLERFLQVASNGSLLRHTLITLLEIISGMLTGVLSASVLGYLLAKSPALEHAIAPYIVASQSVPVVAVAPLLVIWFGAGLFSKILITALTVFFPVLVNTIVGLRSVPEELHDLFRSMRASPMQTFTRLEVPAAMPIFLGGLRIGATLSVIGAVVGEFVGSDRGLGFLINVARGQYDTALVFVTIFTLVLLALGIYSVILFSEKKLLSWQKKTDL